MRKLTRTWFRPVDPGTEAFLSGPSKRVASDGQGTRLARRLLDTGIGLVFIATLGWCNHVIKGLNFEFFYLFSCAVVGWTAGKTGALVCAVVSVLFLYAADSTAESLPSKWIFLGNLLVRLLAFGATGWFAARLAGQARNLEQTVQQRTQRLQEEVGEHKETSELLLEGIQISRHLTDNIADVFWVTDPLKRKFEYVSPGFETVWGKSCASLYASPSAWLEGIHNEDRERVMSSIFTR
jgi:PAS domain-containing protein